MSMLKSNSKLDRYGLTILTMVFLATSLMLLASPFSEATSRVNDENDTVVGITHAAPTPFNPVIRITDVSPDRLWGDAPSANSQEPAGQVDAVAIDPNNPQIIYAASENAGVWKSTDAAHSWQWSSKGLRNGGTVTEGAALAIDDSNSRRLLYASQDDDFRPNRSFGGLYASFDSANTWKHIDLPSCPAPSITSVAINRGLAVVGTACGVFLSRDLVKWVTANPGNGAAGKHFRIAMAGTTIYVCAGNQTWKTTVIADPISVNWVSGPGLPGECLALTPNPDDPANQSLVLYQTDKLLVGSLNFGRQPSVFKSFPTTLAQPADGSGVPLLKAARRPVHGRAGNGPGISYDLFVADGGYFSQYRPSFFITDGGTEVPPSWVQMKSIHLDTHGFAVPSTYNPEQGTCTAYAATDGGVYAVSVPNNATRCEVFQASWVQATHGLHAFGSFGLAGVSQHDCGKAPRPCPTLYIPSNDNGLWGTLVGGNPRIRNAWMPMLNFCGDNGDVSIDPSFPRQVASFRPDCPSVFRTNDFRPPLSGINVAAQYPINIVIKSLLRGITQIMGLAKEHQQPLGDYLAIQHPSSRDANHDTIVRNRNPTPADPTNWVDIAPNNPFPLGSLVAVQATGGSTKPTIYVLAAGSNVDSSIKGLWKGTMDDTGVVSSWKPISNGIEDAVNLIADPYNSDVLYISDLGAQAKLIKSSCDGGKSWQPEPVLTNLATRNGEFLFDCGNIDNYQVLWHNNVSNLHRYACPLNQMVFLRDHPLIRIAVLHPGGVAFSRDAGKNWITIPVTELIDLPWGAFYDPEINPATNTPSLYLALHGRGLIRVDAPFDSLVALNLELRGLPPIYDNAVEAFDETTGISTPLVLGTDDVYRGTEIFDALKVAVPSHTYRYVVRSVRSSQFRRILSKEEIERGVASSHDSVAGDATLQAPATAFLGQRQGWLATYPTHFGGDVLVNPELSFFEDPGHNLAAKISVSRRDGEVCLADAKSRKCERTGRHATIANSYLTVDVDATWLSATGNQVTWSFTPGDGLSNRRYRIVPTAFSNPQLDWLTGERFVEFTRQR